MAQGLILGLNHLGIFFQIMEFQNKRSLIRAQMKVLVALSGQGA
jgi:hypothetical protein